MTTRIIIRRKATVIRQGVIIILIIRTLLFTIMVLITYNFNSKTDKLVKVDSVVNVITDKSVLK